MIQLIGSRHLNILLLFIWPIHFQSFYFLSYLFKILTWMILHFLIYLKMFVFKSEYNSLMIIYSFIMHLKIDNTYWISKCCCITLIILLTLIIEYCSSGKYRWCKHPHTKLPKLHVYHLVCADNKCNIVSFFWVLFLLQL